MTRVKKGLLIGFLAEILLVALVFLLFFYGVLLLNYPSKEVYPVRGVDVSAHQGVIDWEVLSGQGIEFAFIKATEGAAFTDERFAYNYAEAARCGLRVGAYHFFRYDRTGAEQAENFISRVEKTENMLPPVIDVEFYGKIEKDPPAQAEVRRELDSMVQLLREHYGMDPILYATERSYRMYIAGAYEDCDIWIRNVVSKPRLNDGRAWTFWQFTNRRRLKGYKGQEPYIDENVFCGSREQFLQYAQEQSPFKDGTAAGKGPCMHELRGLPSAGVHIVNNRKSPSGFAQDLQWKKNLTYDKIQVKLQKGDMQE